MALILLIDTAGEPGCVALSANENVLAQQSLPEARRQAALLQPTIAAVCAAAGKKITDLEAIAVVSGPGSYTGLRVGLAAAKGLCFALDIPLIMPDRLRLLSLSAATETEKQEVWVLLPARAGEWFAGCYAGKACLVAPRHWEEADLKKHLLTTAPALLLLSPEGAAEPFLEEMKRHLTQYISEVNIEHFAQESTYCFVNKKVSNVNKAVPLYLKPAFTAVSTVKNRPF